VPRLQEHAPDTPREAVPFQTGLVRGGQPSAFAPAAAVLAGDSPDGQDLRERSDEQGGDKYDLQHEPERPGGGGCAADRQIA
jgi:hypothetical protein